MRISIIILTVCLCLCHAYHMREEARLTGELQSIRDLMSAQEIPPQMTSLPEDSTACITVTEYPTKCALDCLEHLPPGVIRW